ncbi:GDP-mannose transporter into the lumen of the Golgi [Balamuthia mandrillaris]
MTERGKAALNRYLHKHSSWVLPVAACSMYTFCSMAMTLTNKTLQNSFLFPYNGLILLYQSVATVLLLYVCKRVGWITAELNFNIEFAKQWLPCNILFVLVLVTSQYSLALLSVAMVTIFKNFTTIFITLGDRILFFNPISKGVALSLSVMFIGSIAAGWYDLGYNGWGYFWMGLNCVSQTSQILYTNSIMRHNKMDPFASSLYNNLLAIPILIPYIIWGRELEVAFSSEAWDYASFYWVLLLNGICGFGISISIFWTIQQTSATTYSVVGSLNKIPLTILGSVLFPTRFTSMGKLSIAVGLCGGIIYSYAKATARRGRSPSASNNNKANSSSSSSSASVSLIDKKSAV